MDPRTIPLRIGVAAAFLAFAFLVLAGLGSAVPRPADAVDAPRTFSARVPK